MAVSRKRKAQKATPTNRKSENAPSSNESKPEVVEGESSGKSGLTEYEQQRLEHIRRNQEYLIQLGLMSAVSDLKEVTQEAPTPSEPKKRKLKANREPDAPIDPSLLRRSGRNVGAKPEYTGFQIDNFGEELDRLVEKRATKQKSAKRDENELIELSRKWLEESRKCLLNVEAIVEKNSTNQGDAWKAEAVKRWGAKVEELGHVTDWKTYVATRISTPPPASPMGLMQEFYAHDPWRLLISCALMSRVSSHDVKERAIASFFKLCPTPSHALEVDPEAVFKILKPLGLFENRMKSVASISEKFLNMPEFDVGLSKEVKMYGIGEFGVDSYLIFCRNQGLEITPTDRTLQSFVRWQRRASNGEEEGSDEESE